MDVSHLRHRCADTSIIHVGGAVVFDVGRADRLIGNETEIDVAVERGF